MNARRALRAASLLAAVAAAAAGAGPRALKPVTAPALPPGMALVAVVVHGPIEVRSLTLVRDDKPGAFLLKVDADADQHTIRLFVVPPGTYRLGAAVLPELRRKPFELEDADPMTFVADKLNYFGDLEVERGPRALRYNLRDRTGRFLTRMREDSPAVLGAHPLAFVGPEGGEWTRSLDDDAR